MKLTAIRLMVCLLSTLILTTFWPDALAARGEDSSAYVYLPWLSGEGQLTHVEGRHRRGPLLAEERGSVDHMASAAQSTSAIGANSSVRAMAVAPNGDLYIGGYFTQVEGVPANRIARWDGDNWHPLGSGLSGYVSALAVRQMGRFTRLVSFLKLVESRSTTLHVGMEATGHHWVVVYHKLQVM